MENIVDLIVKNYNQFLKESDRKLKFVCENLSSKNLSDIVNDFYQSNWEILVESAICIPGKEYLQIYGEGADCNDQSSRVSFADKFATHRIKCISKNKQEIIDLLSKQVVELDNYTFNSFADIPNAEGLRKFSGILLEHNIEDEYILIELEKAVFEKAPILT